MKRLAVLIALTVVLAAPRAGADPGLPTATPSELGLSQERLDRVSDRIRSDIEEGRAAGVVAIIARHGRVGWFEAHGKQDLDSGTPMRKDTIFRLYSMTKPITSVALMILYEEGHFRMKDPVADYLPEFKDVKVAVEKEDPETGEKTIEEVAPERPMTIRDLLRHTSGLDYGGAPGTPRFKRFQEADLWDPNRTLEDFTKVLAGLPLRHHPGTVWEYGFSTDVAARLVEVFSGMPLDRFIDERICKPLGMVDAGFYVPEEKWNRFAALYRWPKGGTLELMPVEANLLRHDFSKRPVFLSGGGGMVSTAADYLRFSQMLLNRGELDGVRILSPKTVDFMTKNHLEGLDSGWMAAATFGLGFFVEPKPGVMNEVGSGNTFGWGGAANTRFWIDPKEDLVGIYMVQAFSDDYVPGDIFRNMMYFTLEK